MSNRFTAQQLKSDLIPHWGVVAVMLVILAGYIIVCQYQYKAGELPAVLPESQRMWIRTLCYVGAIVMFPLTNLIRHIQLRLNQTMPGNKPANKRYLLTIVVSMLLIHSVGILGVVMFFLGDDFNTVYILLGMSALGAFLYRPKVDEYVSIIEALENRNP
ncbi:hypothetical protein [Crenothrix sp.]|uniref:hypothetical protein n=1 Tax=Crenothrix sp. TaxID=3100433 RepID=UPI00374D7031